ncbi:transporter substrate-binding domain-containing protein [Halomonas sp. DWK9]|uniref:substrate-binding periplasmic protein n=1 Tax=Halomonas sp. DWK9 TaxID=3060155 RepID=UPI00287F596E|nr:transporter substrate-binding domain-containing protein [Halomonas sp. DWK9]
MKTYLCNFKNSKIYLFSQYLFIALILSACRYPQNIERPMSDIENGTLYIGITENAPWVIQHSQRPEGVEIHLLEAFAETLSAKIEWHWGSENELLQALNHHQLDIVAGGLTTNARIEQLAAITRPFYTTHYAIGVKDNGQPPRLAPDSIREKEVAVPRLNTVMHSLRELGAHPIIQPHPANAQGMAAGPTWWLLAHDFTPTAYSLAKAHHVMALPKGENALMLALQRYLNGNHHLDAELQRWEAAQ